MPIGIPAAILASAAIGAGMSAFGASSAADSQQQANQTNLDIANATNALNYQMFLQSRGAQGNALLPMYFQSGTEEQLANAALQAYNAEQQALGTPEQQIAGYQAEVQGLMPAAQAGDVLVNKLFSGELTNEQLANIAPVLQARGAVAAAQKEGVLEGLQARLNAIAADRARAGYVGGGSALQKNLLTGATIPAMQEAATVGAQADLANATDVANVKNQAITTKLNNLSLPLTQAGNRIQLQTLPVVAAGQTATAAMQPFNWFKLTPQSFQNQMPGEVKPVANTGQIVGQAGGQFASTLGNYYANQALMQQYANLLKPPTTTTYSGPVYEG